VNRLTATYSTNQQEPRGFAAVERPASAILFRRARRHSRRVRMLRIALPVLIVAAIVVTGLVTWFNPLRMLAQLPGGLGRITITGNKVTMTEPKLAGYTRDERRYELSANSAMQADGRKDVINFEEPRASLEMADRSTIKMKATSGIFDRADGVLTLLRDIVLTSSAGYEAHLSQAVVDTRSGNITSEQPVEVIMQQGTLRANRLEVTKSGEIIRFDGGVTMVLLPGTVDGGSGKAAPQ
jgi:lipopolysaccharide export system protein LptC